MLRRYCCITILTLTTTSAFGQTKGITNEDVLDSKAAADSHVDVVRQLETILKNQETLLERTKKPNEVSLEIEQSSEEVKAIDNKLSKLLENQAVLLEQTKGYSYEPEITATEPTPESSWSLLEVVFTAFTGIVAVVLLILANSWSKKLDYYSSTINDAVQDSPSFTPLQSIAIRLIALYLLLMGWGIVSDILSSAMSFFPTTESDWPRRIVYFVQRRIGMIGRIIIFLSIGAPVLREIMQLRLLDLMRNTAKTDRGDAPPSSS